MDEATGKTLIAAFDRRSARGMLLLPDPVPLHSLWIAQRLHLLLEVNLTVVIHAAVRDLFASRQDCRKGREMLAFLDRHTPPFVIHEDTSRDVLDDPDSPFFALVADPLDWPRDRVPDRAVPIGMRELADAAEQAGLPHSFMEIARAIELPAWG